jgi:DNA repair protein RadC
MNTPFLLNSLDAFRHFSPQFNWNQEEVHVAALNAASAPIATKLMFRGTVDFCLFHPRDIFRFVIQSNASSFIMAHNHPSGDPTPSKPDIAMTKKLKQAANLLQIEFIDHLILTPYSYVSFKELGLMGHGRKRTHANGF